MDGDIDASTRSSLWRSLQKLSNGLGVQREDLYEALQGELSELRDCWQVNMNNGLVGARRILVANLSAHIDRLQLPNVRQPLSLEDRKRQYRLAIAVYFNIHRDPRQLEVLGFDITRRREWLASDDRGLLKVKIRTGQRYFEHAITQIERQIRSAEHAPAMLDDFTTEKPAVVDIRKESTLPVFADPLYIRRPELEHQVARLHKNGVRLIALIGLPGMGKTWLARAVSADAQGSKVLEIRCIGGSIPSTGVRIALSRQDIPTVTPSVDGHEAENLAALVSHKNAPAYLILDNLESTDDLVNLQLEGSRTCIIATCRGEGQLPHSEWSCVRVEEMTDAESLEMVQTRLVGVDVADTNYLAKELRGYPLLMDYACTLISENYLNVSEFCKSIRDDAAQVAMAVPTQQEPMLYVVLNRIAELVRRRNTLAYDLLSYIVLANTDVSPDPKVLEDYAQYIVENPHLRKELRDKATIKEYHFTAVEFAEAMRTLHAFNIVVRVVVTSPEPGDIAVSYRLHDFVRKVLTSVLNSRKPYVKRTAFGHTLSLFARAKAESNSQPLGEMAYTAWLHSFKFFASEVIDHPEARDDEGYRYRVGPALTKAVAAELAVGWLHNLSSTSRNHVNGIPFRWFRWAKDWVEANPSEFSDRDDIARGIKLMDLLLQWNPQAVESDDSLHFTVEPDPSESGSILIVTNLKVVH